MSDIQENPLAEANPESLSDLFEKDPLLLTDADIERIVSELRSARANWLQKEKVTKGNPKRAAPSNLSLADLDIKL